MPDTQGPGKLILGNIVDYKKVFRLQPGEYVQLHQEDEPRNTRSTMLFKRISKLMIVHLVASAIFGLNTFTPSTYGARLLDTKVPEKLILGNTADYKKVFRLQPGEYVQVHQEYEPRNKIAINQTIIDISLGPQYKLYGGYSFESLLTGKCLWRSQWTPINMNKDVIEQYDTFNTKGFPEDLIFGDFNDQSISSTYYDLTNDYDDDVTQIDAALMEMKEWNIQS